MATALGTAGSPDRNQKPQAPTNATLRFWLDEYAFGPSEMHFLREAVAAAGEAAAVAGSARNKLLALKGFQLSHKWDVYWTGRPGCLAAYQRNLQPHQLVNCIPGTKSITEKGRLFQTLKAAYGEAAARIAPLTFSLPAEYFQLARHLHQSPPAAWVLKEEAHQGKGVHVLPSDATLGAALQRDAKGRPKFALAQQLVADQLLVGKRPFYIRVWVLAFGSDPVRAYLFDGGVVVFGAAQKDGGDAAGGGASASDAGSLIVNLWTQDRAAADPWSLHQLRTHLEAAAGSTAYEGLWRQMQLALASTLAAAVPSMRRGAAGLPGYYGAWSGFAVYGADFVVDAALKPWLIELNALPSLAPKVIGSAAGDGEATAAASPFDAQKQAFVGSMLRVLLARHAAARWCTGSNDGSSSVAASMPAAQAKQGMDTSAEEVCTLGAVASEAAAATSGGFVSLTPLVYQALDCLCGPANSSCAVLQALQDGMAGGQPPQRGTCSSSSSSSSSPRVHGPASAWAWLGRAAQLLPQFNWGMPPEQVAARHQASELDRALLTALAAAV